MSDDRIALLHSLRLLAQEARKGQDQGAHPAVEELTAYYDGELAAGREREIQDHLMFCGECPELLLALDGFTKPPDGDAEVSPAGIAASWREMRARLAAEPWFDGGERGRPGLRSLFALPWPAYAALAILAFAAVVPWFLVRSLRQELDLPRLVHLQALAFTTRSDEQRISAKPTEGLTLTISPEGRRYPEYRIELLGARGQVLSERWRPSSETDEFGLHLTERSLPSGRYLLRLTGSPPANPPEPSEERRFALSWH
jgi:hypothetical protein